MPTKIEKDSVTGHMTTGHEWDGLKELNQPLPKWWVYIMYTTVAVSLVWIVLYPSIPGLTGYYHGMLGYSQRTKVDQDVAAVVKQRSAYMDRIKDLSYADIRKDPQLTAIAQTAGRIAFANNCQPCHGAGGGGNLGYPTLAAGSWLWGGTLDDIQQSVTFGIRSGHPDARQSQMPKFSGEGMLKSAEIEQVADWVMALRGAKIGDPASGQKIYAENCAACHGDKGEGKRDIGAPRLSGQVHLNGDSRDAVVAQIVNPRMGSMPNWNTRLDAATIKSVALYVHGLGGGE